MTYKLIAISYDKTYNKSEANNCKAAIATGKCLMRRNMYNMQT